ncbi:hypothetical protein GUJ93_ZPchr0012g19899 [Zizania palustris]|uniref:Uncharacterized protein n=1 Tax=Zizania palustris TaxID=103762 RepID=A0A8J5WS09_ZIZPA|nr:hypothetical protein GUJ93_ZPchr0012g19899 [Zizania palustris]
MGCGGGGGSSAAGGDGGGVGSGVLGAAREEKERGGGAMGRARVRARVRAPHGAGALLIVGGAIVGAAVFHWFRRHRDGGEGEGAKNHGVQHAEEEEVSDGGVIEDEQGEAQRLHQIYKNLSRDDIEVRVDGTDGEATEELYHIQKDDKIIPAELVCFSVKIFGEDCRCQNASMNCCLFLTVLSFALLYFGLQVSEPVEKYDHNSDRDCAEIAADAMVTESVTEDDKYDHNSETDCAETAADDMVTESVTEDDKYDHNSETDCAETAVDSMVTESVTEDDDNSSNNCIEEDEENSRKNTIKNEIIVNDTEGTQNLDESTLNLSSPAVTIEEHANHNGAAQDAEPTEAIPMTENVTHQGQFSEEVNMDTVAETAEIEGTVIEKNEFEHEEEKAKGELVELVGLPAYSSVPSLIKRTEKKSLANPGWNERGMKLEQDFMDSVLKEHELTKGGAVLTMDRSTSYVAILALMFAVAIGITMFIRLSVPLQAT